MSIQRSKTISEATTACLQSFTDCLAVESLAKDEWAENRLADFNLWVSGTGASAQKRASLEFRLALEPEAREVILSLLDQLTKIVDKCKTLTLSGMPNQHEEYIDEYTAIDEQIDRPSSAWSDESTDEELETQLKLLASRSPLHRQMKTIESMLDQLARIAVAVRRSGRNSRLQKADQRFRPEDHDDLQHHLVTILLARPESSGGPFNSFEQQDSGGLQEQIDPTRLSEIQQRLIRCNLKRRNRFLYAQRHAKKLSSGILKSQSVVQHIEEIEGLPTVSSEFSQDIHNPMPVKEDLDLLSQEANALANPTILTDTTASAISHALALQEMHRLAPATSTVMSSTVISLKYPQPPKVAEGWLIFKCPCCCQALPRAYLEDEKWKKHIAHDLSPYTCILPDCTKSETLFATKETWRAHILNEHHSIEYWICYVCRDATQFREQDDFRDHIMTRHAASVPQDEIPLLVDVCRRSMPTDITSCPLCNWGETQEGEIDKSLLLDHIAKDIHSFSLRSLPWADGNGEESDKRINDSKHKVNDWLTKNSLWDESFVEMKEFLVKKADASGYFQHNAYFADSVTTSTSSERDSVTSWVKGLDKGKQEDNSVSFGNKNEMASDQEASAMEVSDAKFPNSQMVPNYKASTLWLPLDMSTRTLGGHSNYIKSIAFSHDSSLIASVSGDKTVRLWRADTGDCIRILEGHSNLIISVAFSQNSSLIVSASNDDTVRLWRTDTGECIRTLKGQSRYVWSVAFSHDSSLIASALGDNTIRLWRTDTASIVRILEGHSSFIESVAFSRLSSLIASASSDDTVRLWSADTGECIRIFEGHTGSVISVVFSHNSVLIASASRDKTIRLWGVGTGECFRILKGHRAIVWSVAFSHDSSLIASASSDDTVRLWRVDTGECIRILEGHVGSVLSVVFSHDSSLIASSSKDRTIRLWHAGGQPGNESEQFALSENPDVVKQITTFAKY